jgi:heme exporter protein B
LPSPASENTQNGSGSSHAARRPPPPRVGFFAKVRAVFWREALTELRSRFALNAIGMFALATLMVVGYSAGSNVSHKMLAALLWLILLFSAMTGLSRVFVREVEARTQDALRLTSDPTALMLGKMAFNGALLGLVQLIIVPLYAMMTGLPVRDMGLFLAMMALGNLGMAVSSAVLAAIVAKAGARNALFPVLALPILIPLLLSLVGGTYAALVPDMKYVKGVGFEPNPFEIRQTAWQSGGGYARLALAFSGMLGPVSLVLFDLIWNEE